VKNVCPVIYGKIPEHIWQNLRHIDSQLVLSYSKTSLPSLFIKHTAYPIWYREVLSISTKSRIPWKA